MNSQMKREGLTSKREMREPMDEREGEVSNKGEERPKSVYKEI